MTDYSGVTWRVNYGEIAERDQFRVGRVDMESFDAYFELASLADLIAVLNAVTGLALNQVARGSTLQARKVSDGLTTTIRIEPRLDTGDPVRIMTLRLSELPDFLYALTLFQSAVNPIPDDWDLSDIIPVAILDRNGKLPEKNIPDRLSQEALGAAYGSASDVTALKTLTDTGRLSTPSLISSTVQTMATSGVVPENLYHSSRILNWAISSANGQLVQNISLNRGYAIPVVPGEVYSLSRESTVNPTFRVAFLATPPATGAQTFGEIRADAALKIENVVVPATATHMYLSLSGSAGTIPEIKIERSPVATKMVPTLIDYGIGIMNLFPKNSTDLDDTERLQRALNFCATKGIPFSAAGDKWYTGQYLLREITVPPNLTMLDFSGAYLKRPNLKVAPYSLTVEQRKWVRMLAVTYNADDDMRLMTIANAILDGNARENWSDPLAPSYEQEQASLIVIGANSAKAGRANVHLHNIETLDCTSDGVHVVANANVSISSLHSKGCFRGGLTITGGRSVVNATDLTLETPTAAMRDGIDIEVDGPGYGGVWATHVTLKGVVMDDDLDVSANAGSTILIDGLVMRGTGWNIGANHGTVVISNSTLRRGTGSDRLLIRNGGSVTLNSVDFHAPAGLATVPVQQFEIAGETERGLVRFRDCVWVSGSDGVASNISKFADFEFLGGRFTAGLTGAAIGGTFSGTNFSPKSVLINGTVFENAGYWLRHTGVPAAGGSVVRVASIFVTNPASTGMNIFSPLIVWLNSPTFEYGFQSVVVGGGAPTFKGTRVDLTV